METTNTDREYARGNHVPLMNKVLPQKEYEKNQTWEIRNTVQINFFPNVVTNLNVSKIDKP